MKRALLSSAMILLAMVGSTLSAQLKLPALVGDHMVLQQQAEITLWGWDKTDQFVSVTPSWTGKSVTTKTKSDGSWKVKVTTPEAGGPYNIHIKGSREITINDVMTGEVWLCSGQSNMEMPLKGWPGQPITGSEQAIAEADYPQIRLFTVARKIAYEPEDDCVGSWGACTPELAAEFSATAFFFGRELYRKLKIPVGLIHSSWGGTPAEAWTSNEFIDKIPYFHTDGEHCNAKNMLERNLKKYQVKESKWLKGVGFNAPDVTPAWALEGFDDSGWMDIEVPQAWAETGVGNFQGIAEYRVEFKVPKKWTGKKLLLSLGVVDEMDQTWVNGTLVGSQLTVSNWYLKRVYEVPAGLLKKKGNVLAVRVANTSGQGGITADRADLKIMPADSKVVWQPLAGTWKIQKEDAFSALEPAPWCEGCSESNLPTTLYNGMIAPLINYNIKGAIWYQGESNRYDGELYKEIFPNMIQNWRNDWHLGNFSFYFVQIAPYTYTDANSTGLLREAQQYTYLTVPNTGMVVTMDIGSLTTIHPPDKQTVGWRLAQWALNRDYGKDMLYVSGPIYNEYIKEQDKIRIFFTYTCGGFYTPGEELTCFTIAGPDKKFYPAKAVIDHLSIVVSSPDVPDPVAVRFAWESTDIPNLYNMARFPAAPFRTDDWEERLLNR